VNSLEQQGHVLLPPILKGIFWGETSKIKYMRILRIRQQQMIKCSSQRYSPESFENTCPFKRKEGQVHQVTPTNGLLMH